MSSNVYSRARRAFAWSLSRCVDETRGKAETGQRAPLPDGAGGILRGLRNVGSFAAATLAAAAVLGQVTPPPGYIYDRLVLASPTQSCVAAGPGGTFVGIGPGFSANAQAVVLVKESGAARLVSFGFNSIGDCAYDAAGDVLYVTDNAGPSQLAGALGGNTVYAIASASTTSGVTAVGQELLPANSIPNAASVAVAANGDVYVSDATGGGAGRVLKIDVSGAPSVSTFASGFDFTAGLAVHPSTGDVLVAETLSTFGARIRRFNGAGAEQPVFAGPSFAFGSYDLAWTFDGLLLVTGAFLGDVVAFNAMSMPTPFAGGLTFATGVATMAFTGRVEILSSFSGTDEDRSLHRFTPVDELVPGAGKAATECFHEFYGVKLVPPSPGRPARAAICVDGEACDADGTVNDRCEFPLGFCFNVPDPRFTGCPPVTLTELDIASRPPSLAVAAAADSAQAALPLASSSCFFSDGFVVPVRNTRSGKKPGTANVKVQAASAAGAMDRDTLKLICRPAP